MLAKGATELFHSPFATFPLEAIATDGRRNVPAEEARGFTSVWAQVAQVLGREEGGCLFFAGFGEKDSIAIA